MSRLHAFLFLLRACAVLANTEKAIFLGPESLQVPTAHPTLEDLQLEVLSPQRLSLRTHIAAEFPTNDTKYGQSSWLLLQDLQEGQRYEVRVCWAATDPTSFRLDTYTLTNVFENPELITSLADYSESRQSSPEDELSSVSKTAPNKHTYNDAISSTLFLRIQAAADYFTMNETLMKDVPPVYVDIILDPFLFNAIPQSLIPTIAYIILLTFGSWFLAKYVNAWLASMAIAEVEVEKKTL